MANKRLWRENFQTVLEGDAFDLWDWLRAVERLPQLDRLNKRTSQEFTGQPAQDAFLSLYQDEPQLADNPPAGIQPLHSIMKRAMATPDWEGLHQDTKGDLLTAAFGAKGLIENVFNNLPEEVKEKAREQKQAAEEQEKAQDQADSLQEQLDWLQSMAGQDGDQEDEGQPSDQPSDQEGEGQPSDQGGQEGPGGQPSDQGQPSGQAGAGGQMEAASAPVSTADLDQQLQSQISELQADRDAAQQEADAMAEALAEMIQDFEETADKYDARIRAAFNDAAKDAGDEAAEMTAFIKGFTEAAGGDPQNVSPEMAELAMRAMAQNKNLKDLADKLGWASRVVNAERRKSPYGRTELAGIEMGPLDLGRMTGQELVALAADDDNPLHIDFLRRAVDSGVLLRQYEGEDDEQGKGTLVILRDESGSMAGPEHAMAVAVEWALLDAARKDNRKFFSIPFSGHGQFEVWEAPEAGKPDFEGTLAHLSHFYGGGTEPYGPLSAALDLIKEKGLKADILCLTDGSFARPSAEFLAKLEAIKNDIPLRIEAVVIGGWGRGQTEGWADRVHNIRDLVEDREALREAFAGVV